MATRKRKLEHYVNNRDFSDAISDYVKEAHEYKEAGKEVPGIPHYIGECFLRIAEGLSHKPNFYQYTWREEMVMDAVENCIKAVHNYDISKATRSGKPNAFGYFTQISYYAFLRRIAKEKRQQETKEKYIKHHGYEDFVNNESDHNGSSMIERMKANRELYNGSDDDE
jgi:hypothetical protein